MPNGGKRLNLAAKARELELVAEQPRRRTVFVREIGIEAMDRFHKEPEVRGAELQLEPVRTHEERRVVQEDVAAHQLRPLD
jgi:hypothetical protein